MSTPLRLLVIDAYDRAGREALARAGATAAGELYARMLDAIEPGAGVDRLHPADADASLPSGAALADYDGIAWTGSNLSVRAQGDAGVRRQIELVRAGFAAGVPGFGSCYAAQLAVVAAGGRCREHPAGREFGVSRRIEKTAAGRSHPLLEGKPAVYDAWTSHADEIAELPAGAERLASNGWSAVQAVAVRSGPGEFWALQYHPEYDPHEVARLCALRAEELVAQGTFADGAEAEAWIADAEALHADPQRTDLAHRLGVDGELLDPERRHVEARNWLEYLVKPARRR